MKKSKIYSFKKRGLTPALLAGACSLCLSGPIHATVIVDDTGQTVTVQCDPSKITLGGNASDGCAGYYDVKGNFNSTSEANLLNTVTDGNDWTFVYKIDDALNPGAIVNGIEIKLLSADIDQISGNYTIGWADVNGSLPLNLPVTLDIATAFKGSTEIGYFFFEAEILTNNPFQRSGTFELQITNKNGNLQKLSHESLFVRNLLGDGGGGEELPEPSTLLLSALGLIGIGFYGRRRRQS